MANEQRKVIYSQRDELLTSESISETISSIRERVVNDVISLFVPPQSMEEQWDIPGLEKQLEADFNMRFPIREWLDKEENFHEEHLRERILTAIRDYYLKKTEQAGPEVLSQFEKTIMLQTLDTYWREHLAAMDYLRQGIHLRGYAQKNPKQEYKREAFELFIQMLDKINAEVISTLSKFEVRVQQDQAVPTLEAQRQTSAPPLKMQFHHSEANVFQTEPVEEDDPEVATVVRDERKVGRNEPCPCGSGKKYKHCHGQI